MNLWTMIVIIVALAMVSEMYKFRIKYKSKSTKDQRHSELHQRRIDKLEERVINLETLVLEKEKLRRFDALGDEETG